MEQPNNGECGVNGGSKWNDCAMENGTDRAMESGRVNGGSKRTSSAVENGGLGLLCDE